MSETTVTLKVRSRFDAHQPEVFKPELVDRATDYFARMIVDNVAINTAQNVSRGFTRNLRGYVERDIYDVITDMAKKISTGIVTDARFDAPRTQFTLRGKISDTAARLDWGRTFYAAETKPAIHWHDRSEAYMAMKARHGKPDKWWEYTGDLKHYLSDPDVYTSNFGPVNVNFFPSQNNSITKPERFASIGGLGRTKSFKVGRLEVAVFGKITASMLPSLASGDPADIGPGPGVASLFEGTEAGVKLLSGGRDTPMRRVLDPFVSFYLTRAIPDAVFRRVAQRLPYADNGLL